MKKGANGIKLCFLRYAHVAPNMHANAKAMAKPVGPHQRPPTLISFMSPMPIGLSEPGFRRANILSNKRPVTAANIYPNAMPIAPDSIFTGHGKNVVIITPIISNGNRYPSGIIRRRRSVFAILYESANAVRIKTAKKDQNMYKNIISPLRFESVMCYYIIS